MVVMVVILENCVLPTVDVASSSTISSTKGLFTLVTKGLDQSFSCIVIGGKVGAGPSSLYTIKSDQGLQWMKK
jgi:hypothetical protein